MKASQASPGGTNLSRIVIASAYHHKKYVAGVSGLQFAKIIIPGSMKW
jgi:hypothetical protein